MKIRNDVPLIKSNFLQVLQKDDEIMIWHSLFGNPKIVSGDVLEFLNAFTNPRSLSTSFGDYNMNKGNEASVAQLIEAYYLIPVGFNERALLAEKMKDRERGITNGSLIDNLELIMSEACNFRCTYCIHFNNLETSDRINSPKKFMNLETAKKVVDAFLKILGQQEKRVTKEEARKVAEINFGGGEPLLAWPVIEQVLEYCVSHYGQKFTFQFSINTNASLITSEIAQKLKQYHVEIASSLDGLREGNDRVRITKLGGGTFNSITKGFEILAMEGYPLEGIAVTVNEHNFPYLDEGIIDWAVERNMWEVRIDIDVIDMVEIPVEAIVERLMRIRRYAKEHHIEISGFWSRPAENLNESTLEDHVAFCGAVRGNSMCVSPSGNIYGCGYSTTQLGTLAQIENFHTPEGGYHRFVRDRLTGAMEMCKGCKIEGQCGGGCNITQEFARATKTTKIERMCDFYRRMTEELLLEQLHKEQLEGR